VAGAAAVETFDLSAGQPRRLGLVSLYGTPSDVALNAAGTRLYVVAGAVWTFDVSSGVPVYLSSISYSFHSYSAVVNAAGTVLYVLLEQTALVVVPLDAVGKPAAYSGATFVGRSFLLKDLAVNPASTRAYVLGAGYSGPSKLLVYDVSGPGNPPLLGSALLSGQPVAVALNAAGTRAYVVSKDNGTNTLQTFDLSGALPVSLGTVPTGTAPAAVALNAAGTRLYVPNSGDNTLQTYDISGALPVSLSVSPTGSAPQDVAAAPTGTRLYVANSGDNTLQVFDQQNQPRPLTVGATGTAGSLGAATLPGAGRLPAAYGTVSSGGAAAGLGSVFSVLHSATGVYRLSFINTPLSTTDLNQATVVAALAGVAPGSVSYRTGRGYVEVLTYAPGGAAFDRDFTFSVTLP
jgi:DNA-binding beta-propeller fold protein YncE